MTVEVILNKMKYLRIHYVSIHINFLSVLINECVRKTFLKFPHRRKDGVFFVRCRRTYVLDNWFGKKDSYYCMLEHKKV